jgi:arylsulfatase A-like enzyme
MFNILTHAFSPPIHLHLNETTTTGHNQVGYYAKETGNEEISTPNIDKHAESGIIMDRGYTTQWCGPTRAALQTGRFNAFNLNVPNSIYAFDDDIGFVGGLPPHIKTLPAALKETADYAATYHGKWGIGGTAWSNTPVGVGYDAFHG